MIGSLGIWEILAVLLAISLVFGIKKLLLKQKTSGKCGIINAEICSGDELCLQLILDQKVSSDIDGKKISLCGYEWTVKEIIPKKEKLFDYKIK